MSKIEIRRAVFRDLFALERLLASSASEAGRGFNTLYQVPNVYHTTLNLIAAGLVFVAAEELENEQYRVVGTIMVDAKKWHWHNGVTYLESVHFYVAKQYRSSTTESGELVADALISAVKDLADRNSLPLLIQHIFNENRAEAKERFMEKNGLEYMGSNFMYIPQPSFQDSAPEDNAVEATAA